MSALSLVDAHRQFEAALPAIDNTLRFQFRRLPRARRAEAIADARAAAWHAWYGQVTRLVHCPTICFPRPPRGPV